MLRLVHILFISLCTFIFGQGAFVITERTEYVEHNEQQVVANRYTEQLECAHRCNNTAESSHSITVPASSSTTSCARAQHQRLEVGNTPIASYASKPNFSVQSSLYRICCSRVIDYYLYTLCCLRL